MSVYKARTINGIQGDHGAEGTATTKITMRSRFTV